MTKEIKIAGRPIGEHCPPYIIAELSANHNGDINRAFKIIEAAKKAGADAIKLQTYSADTITINCDKEDFQIHGGLWDGKNLYELYQWAQMPWDWHKPLFEKARKLDITIFSSPFDVTAVDLLEDLNAPAYKIASFEAVDIPLIRYVAATGKPMIISTGMADQNEINEAVDAARSAGCSQLVVLHCVSGYPAPASDYNLKTINDIANRFNVVAGLSDHTTSNTTAIASIALGASVIEKHVTMDRNGGGPDDSFSIEPNELAFLCKESKIAWSARGDVDYKKKESEKANVKFRRSLYVVKNITKGDIVKDGDIKSIRPGFGVNPKYYDQIIGRVAKVNLEFGTPVKLDDFE